jgi:hypothetical protein
MVGRICEDLERFDAHWPVQLLRKTLSRSGLALRRVRVLIARHLLTAVTKPAVQSTAIRKVA